MLYRIHTENKTDTINALIKLVTDRFDGFSLSYQVGYWQDKREPSVCFEIDTPADDVKIDQLCRDICKANDQQCVLLQQIDSQSCTIDRQGGIKCV